MTRPLAAALASLALLPAAAAASPGSPSTAVVSLGDSYISGEAGRWLRLVAVGMSTRQVAAELFVSVKTVQFHLTHIYAKLGVGSRAELAAQFRE